MCQPQSAMTLEQQALRVVRASMPVLPAVSAPTQKLFKKIPWAERISVSNPVDRYGRLAMGHVLLARLIRHVVDGKIDRRLFVKLAGVRLSFLGGAVGPVGETLERGKFYSDLRLFRLFEVYCPLNVPAKLMNFHGQDLFNFDVVRSPLDSGERVSMQKHRIGFMVLQGSNLGWTHQPYAHALLERKFKGTEELLDKMLAHQTERLGRELLSIMPHMLESIEQECALKPALRAASQEVLQYWAKSVELVINS